MLRRLATRGYAVANARHAMVLAPLPLLSSSSAVAGGGAASARALVGRPLLATTTAAAARGFAAGAGDDKVVVVEDLKVGSSGRLDSIRVTRREMSATDRPSKPESVS